MAPQFDSSSANTTHEMPATISSKMETRCAAPLWFMVYGFGLDFGLDFGLSVSLDVSLGFSL